MINLASLDSTLASFGPALANHLWQSTAFALGAWLLTLALRSNQARVRHAVWLAASIKFLMPFSLLIAAGNLLPHPKQAVAPVVYSAMDVVEEPFAQIILPPALPVVHVPTLRERIKAALPAALGVLWLLGAAGVLFIWASRWRVVRRTLHEAEPATEGREFEILRRFESPPRFQSKRDTHSPVPHSSRALCAMSGKHNARHSDLVHIDLRLSAARMEPGIFGIFRPVLVWPRELSARLDDEHIEAILAHELAHVRRRDNLTAAMHMLVETVFWFHPLVWWMERRMVAEREQACDEAVVALARPAILTDEANGGPSFPLISLRSMNGAPGDSLDIPASYAEIYAEALLKTCRFCIESPLVCVAGVTGADLKQRVVEIVTGRALLQMSWAKKMLLVASAVCVVAAPVVLGQGRAAQRLMLAAIEAAPKPLQTAAKAMLADAASSNSDAAEASQTHAPADSATAASTDDMSLGPEFEVATIRPADRNDGRRFYGSRVDDSGRYTLSAGTLGSLVSFAYASNPLQTRISGGPKWAQSDFFDVNAKVDAAYMDRWDKLSYNEKMDRIKPMIRTLLAQRFQLKLHTEMEPTPVYALVQAKGGAKLKEVPAPDAVDTSPDAALKWMDQNPGKPRPGSILCTGNTCSATAVTMKNAIGQIRGSARADRIVIDQTGLKGYYNFTIPMAPPGDEDAMAEVADALGFKFEPRTMPVETFVIDSAEKPSIDGAEVDSSDEGLLSAAYRKWLDEDVHWLITPQERTDFLKLTSDKDREVFIDAFWERRNPPGAAKDAYKAEIYARIADANRSYENGKPGWSTDRGRAIIQFGKPDSVTVHGDNGYETEEVWSYSHLGAAGGSATLRFVRAVAEFRLQGAWPDTGAPSAHFEVVSVKPATAGQCPLYMSGPAPNGHYTGRCLTLWALIYNAYQVRSFQDYPPGLPAWADKDKFDIEAKADDATAQRMQKLSGKEQGLLGREMLQSLLRDRFSVQVHYESQIKPIYELVVAKGGFKLKPLPPEQKPGGISAGPGQIVAHRQSITEFTNFLSLANSAGRIVADKTGLAGNYEIDLKWTPDDRQSMPDAGPTLFTAIEEQLGLKLMPARGPVDVLYIDHAERPSEN